MGSIGDVRMALVRRMPSVARRVLLMGSGGKALATALSARRGIVCDAIEGDEAQTGAAGPYDAILVWLDWDSQAGLPLPLPEEAGPPVLSSEGLLLWALPVPPGGESAAVEAVRGVLERAGLRLWGWEVVDDAGPAHLHLAEGVSAAFHVLALPEALLREGRAVEAYERLLRIPPERLKDDTERAAQQGLMQRCILDHDAASPRTLRLSHFFTAQTHFYRAVAEAPGWADPYLRQAEFWRRIGDEAMADRLLRCTEGSGPAPGRADPPEEDMPPDPIPPDPAVRVLFITHPRPHYGLDALYAGLCAVLGSENVVEYPWKPTLHGHRPPELANYPCLFRFPGTGLGLDEVLSALRAGRFDLVLYGDTEGGLEHDTARRLMEAAGAIPWAVVDQGDDPIDRREEVQARVGRADRPVYFKREMLRCHDYGDGAFPLPFSYPDERIPAVVDGPRPIPLFWAGHRAFGLRRLHLERVEHRLGIALDCAYHQEQYAEALASARVGLSLFGLGFDTVRYWELPAHGCMLLAERPPIRIPHNFVEGETCMYFDDPGDLAAKLDWCLAHREAVARIAQAGHEHLVRHHTASARARQMLARLMSSDSVRAVYM